MPLQQSEQKSNANQTLAIDCQLCGSTMC